jgi:hypothetical protein
MNPEWAHIAEGRCVRSIGRRREYVSPVPEEGPVLLC